MKGEFGGSGLPRSPRRTGLRKNGRFVGRRADVHRVVGAEALRAGGRGQAAPLAPVGAAGREHDAARALGRQPANPRELGGGERLEPHQHRSEERRERVAPEHHDHVPARVADAALPQRREREHGRAQHLVASEAVEARDAQDPARLQVVEVLLEGLDRVQVVLRERIRLARARRERVREADVHLVVMRVAGRER